MRAKLCTQPLTSSTDDHVQTSTPPPPRALSLSRMHASCTLYARNQVDLPQAVSRCTPRVAVPIVCAACYAQMNKIEARLQAMHFVAHADIFERAKARAACESAQRVNSRANIAGAYAARLC